MNQLGLFGKRPKEKYHSYKGDVGKVADNIINRDFSTEKAAAKVDDRCITVQSVLGQMLYFSDFRHEYQ